MMTARRTLTLPPVSQPTWQVPPTGKEPPCSAFSKLTAPGRKEFADCCRSAQENRAVTHLYNPDKDLELQIWQEAGPGKYNSLQIYTTPRRKAIAVKPIGFAPDPFANGLGLSCLEHRGNAARSPGAPGPGSSGKMK